MKSRTIFYNNNRGNKYEEERSWKYSEYRPSHRMESINWKIQIHMEEGRENRDKNDISVKKDTWFYPCSKYFGKTNSIYPSIPSIPCKTRKYIESLKIKSENIIPIFN